MKAWLNARLGERNAEEYGGALPDEAIARSDRSSDRRYGWLSKQVAERTARELYGLEAPRRAG